MDDHLAAVGLAAGVAVVGMPHGGLDHRVGRALLGPVAGRHWPGLFLAGYPAVMGVVLAGWVWCPLVTLALFVLLSAVHFGAADAPPGRPGGWGYTVLQGGMVVWVPALFRPADFTRLLGWVVPDGRWPDGVLSDPAVRAGLWAALGALAVGGALQPWRDAARTAGFAVLFAVAAPLVGFGVYFCGWHSVVELARLARQADPGNPAAGFRRVVRAAAPLSAAAVLLAAAGWAAVAADGPLTPGLVRVVFVGLSVVAVPHLLLHLAAGRAGVHPFTPVGAA